LGVHVCGGRGKHSRATPGELLAVGERTGLDGAALGQASRLVAKVDSAAVQDGFDLYLHGFIVTDDGRWTVVQQGMNDDLRQARRYHWLSEGLSSFVDQPHAAIDGRGQGVIVNLTDHRAQASRQGQVELLRDLAPDLFTAQLARLEPRAAKAPMDQPSLPHLVMPDHHDVRAKDVDMRRVHAAFTAAARAGPADFAGLLAVPGVGARTVRALAMVAEVVHGAPYRFSDPARFSLAHGGKDRHPYAVPLVVYDQTIKTMRSAIRRARLGHGEELAALRRLDDQARRLEGVASGPSFTEKVAEEAMRSADYGGRSVFGWEKTVQERLAAKAS
ncbi:MAG: hypothetical protein JWM33_650, partial [Caulobacteraceae bacterium]|nr:hypothetical protein [Caulobacteraceae bacterium]